MPDSGTLPPFPPEVPSQVQADRLAHLRLLERMGRRPPLPVAADAGATLPVPAKRSQIAAMLGRAGVDYLPDETCTTCGAIPWYDGRRWQLAHDAAAHAGDVSEKTVEHRIERQARELQRGRSWLGAGDDDDDT
jgi:hypothetical protein